MSPENVSTRAWVEQIMGMPISIHVRAAERNRPDVGDAVDRAFAHLRLVDDVFSTWRPDSDVMRLRRGELTIDDAHPWIREVQQLCERAAAETGGLFTTDLIGPDGSRGWDPTGLVKGWAVGDAAQHLRDTHHVAFSINAGGDIVCGLGVDSPELARPWRVGVEDPQCPSTITHVVAITDGAVATSGTSARGAHIIDPRTGSAVQRIGSTTVVGPELVWADIWATTTFIDRAALLTRPLWAQYAMLGNNY
nr:FAD:protein FMN transferase [Rhodococcus sp. (in: high G+C Gram-positive bacteria)]